MRAYDVMITSYDIALREKSFLSRQKWAYLVIDEAHRIKNENSKLSEIVRNFFARYRLLLTGTPLQNNLHELWALLNFLRPDLFDSSEEFEELFGGGGGGGAGGDSAAPAAANGESAEAAIQSVSVIILPSIPVLHIEFRKHDTPFATTQQPATSSKSADGESATSKADDEKPAEADTASADKPEASKKQADVENKATADEAEAAAATDPADVPSQPSDKIITKLHMTLQPFMLRRLKREVEKQLPEKKELKVHVPFVPAQRQFYRAVLLNDFNLVAGNNVPRSHAKLMNLLMQLRKVCNHPYLFENVDPSTDKPPQEDDLQHLVDASAKMKLLDKLLMRFKEQGCKVLLFSQMVRMLDILDDYCSWRRFSYSRLDGQTDVSCAQS